MSKHERISFAWRDEDGVRHCDVLDYCTCGEWTATSYDGWTSLAEFWAHYNNVTFPRRNDPVSWPEYGRTA